MTDTASTTSPSGATAPPQRELNLTWALVLISIAQLMVVLDATIANIALPFIQKDLEISNANLSWIVTGYALAFGSLLLLGGRLGDLVRSPQGLHGRPRHSSPWPRSWAGWPPPSLCCSPPAACRAWAPRSPPRPRSALITTTFPAGPARNRAFAVYAAMSGAGAAVGLILGGWLTGTMPEVSASWSTAGA